MTDDYSQLTRDPVLTLAHVIVATQHLVSRRSDPTHATALSIGQIAAGTAYNVIPNMATARGSLRALFDEDMTMLRRELTRTVESVADAFGCAGTVELAEGEPALVNDEWLADPAGEWLRRAGYEIDRPFRSCGADDFAYYSALGPSLMMFVGVGNGDPGDPGRGRRALRRTLRPASSRFGWTAGRG